MLFLRRATNNLGVEKSTECDDPDAVRGGIDAALTEKVKVFADLGVPTKSVRCA